MDGLGQRRRDATRERLLTGEGIPAERLIDAEATGGPATPAATPDAEGRVEFTVAAGE